MKVKEKSNTTRRNKRALFTVNIYRTTSSLLINGPQVKKIIQEILPAIQTWAQDNGTVIDMCDQELERMLKKLVRDRRTAASSITTEKERADHVEETQENTKCNFQIEQSTKIKNTEGKYQESCTNVEVPNTKQKLAKGSQNNESNITQENQQNKLPVPVATEQKELKANEIMQDRDKMEEEKDTKNTGEEMQGRNTTGQAKTEQTEEAETTEQEQKEKGTAEHIVNNQQKNTEKQGKSWEEGEEQEKITDTSKNTEPQPHQEYKNQQAKTRIENQNEVETVDKENFEIEKQKPYQKTLDTSNRSDREENN